MHAVDLCTELIERVEKLEAVAAAARSFLQLRGGLTASNLRAALAAAAAPSPAMAEPICEIHGDLASDPESVGPADFIIVVTEVSTGRLAGYLKTCRQCLSDGAIYITPEGEVKEVCE